MNSQKNIFLSAINSKKQDDGSKEFLNNLNDLSRKMYDNNQKKPEQVKHDFEGDVLLNQGVRNKNLSHEKDRIIRDMREENKGLKSQISLVMEKDKEIYRLQCENTLLQKETDEYKHTTVTDESLKRDNEDLQTRVSEMVETIRELREMDITLKHKLIQLYRENQSLKRSSEPLSVISDEQLASYIRSKLK